MNTQTLIIKKLCNLSSELIVDDYYLKRLTKKEIFSFALANRGFYYLKNNELDKALTDLNKALELNPKNLEARFYLGKLYTEQENFDRAIDEFSYIISKNPNDFRIYLLRANLYRLTDQMDKALLDYDKANELKPRRS